MLVDAEDLLAGLLKAAVDLVPIDDVPPSFQILGSAVLVLKVVSVLPNVVAHYGIKTFHKWAILVSSADYL